MDEFSTQNYAVIDIGSNSVRLVIYDLAHKVPLQIFNEKIFSGLGRDLSNTGCLHPEAKLSALKAIQAFVLLCEAQKISKLSVIGTAALRDAKDSKNFCRLVKTKTGQSIRILTGEEEAYYASLGVLSKDPKASGLVADFGGGSLELSFVQKKKVKDCISLPVGAFRLLPFKKQAAQILDQNLTLLPQYFYGQKNFHAIGGSWRSLAKTFISTQHKNHNKDIDGVPIPALHMIKFCQKMATHSPNQLRQQYKFERQRSQIMPISAFALAHILKTLQVENFIVSSSGVRDGILFDYLA
jgi:exopolyphosphatase/guanosine-5'-triphosphate,3'-diphosphate pyrophosphatase